MSFAALGVPARLCSILERRGIVEPFPIQTATVPDALAGRDICGCAPTGSGKTIAYGIVVAERATRAQARRPRTLVLVPTRELAKQVDEELTTLLGDRNAVISIYGGVGYGPQRRALNRGARVVVACPGRLEDLVNQGDVDLSQVDLLIVDEADRMADMGFFPAVRRLLDRTPSDRQTLLFSATLDGEVDEMIQVYQRDPVRHDVTPDDPEVAEVSHLFWRTARPERVAVTKRLVDRHGRSLVFCRTKRGADKVVKQLSVAGIDAEAMHGNRSQAQRERALAAFRSGKVQALVATDVVARGIHVDDVACVVHFDPPADAKDYIHRSGRTGRAGAPGLIVTLVGQEDEKAVKAIRSALGRAGPLEPPGDSERRPTLRPVGDSERRPTLKPKPVKPLKPVTPLARVAEAVVEIDPKRDARTIGTVKFFHARKGYGFVAPDRGDDVFVHFSGIDGQGVRRLEVGQRVAFDVVPGRKGGEAKNVKVVSA